MKDSFLSLKERIQKRRATIAIIGLGYVGLPLALAFVKKGFCVVGIDMDKDRVSRLQKKESYITDVSTRHLHQVLASRKFEATMDMAVLKDADVIMICVPTPLKKRYDPDISFIKSAVKSVSRYFTKGTLVILESTTYPGTTEEIILPILLQSGLRHNHDFFLSFSPERIDPGNKNFSVERIPKVVGGLSREASQLAALLYRSILTQVVPVSSARTAEAVKLLENTFRLVNIALIDELAMMCHRMNIDIWEVIAAAKTKPFGFMPFYPGPGVGGHCIPKDPLYLYWKARKFGFSSRFIKLASLVISAMPSYVVTRVQEALERQRKSLRGAKVMVVGVTYKKDVKDLRKSPSLDIINSLQENGAVVSYTDPLIPFLRIHDINMRSVAVNAVSVRKSDCVIIATDHSRVDYQLIRAHAKLVFDCRNVYSHTGDPKIVKL